MRKETEKNEVVIVKSNDLISASYQLSLNEQRLILLAISQVRRDQVVDVTQNQLFRVTAQEFSEFTGIHPKTAYRELTAAVKQLYERSLKVMGEESYCRWIQRRTEREKGSGHVEIRFSYDVAKHLSELSERFTKYNIKDAIQLRSVYAIRIYETIVSLKGYKNNFYLSIETIREMFDLKDKYKLTADLKRNVIQEPINEINNSERLKGRLNVTWTEKRAGRKILGFTISFEFNENPDKNKEKKKLDNPDKKAKTDAPSGPSKRALEMMEEAKGLSSEKRREEKESILDEIQKLLARAEELGEDI